MIEIDGSIGEGGGQVLRTALSLSCILRKPVRIFNIRAGRSKPGLQPQHFTGVDALAKICNAKVSGLAGGSVELTFEPGGINGGEYRFDVGTAGSVILVAQTVLPVLLFGKEKGTVAITGGTHVMRAPNAHYFGNVFLPAIGRFGARAKMELVKYGFYPKGGGEVKLEIEPGGGLIGTEFLGNEGNEVNGIVCSGNLPLHVSEREKAEVLKHFPEAEVKIENVRGVANPGNAVTLWKGFLGGSALGEIRKSAELVAQEACAELKREIESGACVDRHLADQLLLYAALAKGGSRLRASELTLHAETNMGIIEKFTGRKFEVEGNLVSVS